VGFQFPNNGRLWARVPDGDGIDVRLGASVRQSAALVGAQPAGHFPPSQLRHG